MSRKIIICFDGTCNDPKDADQGENPDEKAQDGSISNIFKLHLLLGGYAPSKKVETERQKNLEKQLQEQENFYYQGVGTEGGKLKQLVNSGLALTDVKKIINNAADDLHKAQPSANDSIYIFGFSRGAAIARKFAAKVNELLKWRDPDAAEVKIRFLGVFETVASIGLPNLKDNKKPVSDVVFEDRGLSEHVQEALHMLCLDDKRTAFMPTLFSYDPDRVTEVWFAGAHSDVGGGYRYDGLSDVTLQFLLNEITRRKIGLKYRMPVDIDYDTKECRQLKLTFDDMDMDPKPLGKSHEQDRSWLLKWTTCDRDMRVHSDDPEMRHKLPPPIVHFSVLERIFGDSDYRPVSMSEREIDGVKENQIPHTIWRPDVEGSVVYNVEGTVEYKGIEEHLKNGPPAPKKLEVGESRLVTVYAHLKYNRSFVYANKGKGEVYSFSIEDDQVWYDSGIDCGPKGWKRSEEFPWYSGKGLAIHFMEDERRHPDAEWFEVVGTIGQKEQVPFRVYDDEQENLVNLNVNDRTGELFFFANDLEDRYGNNFGFIQIRVKREADRAV
ncbi:MAG: DUF2235 domain-containing protein [Magnetococcales bacterium]|nr:DUF2235 domain-containing protein [Magnetococcales bacterium]